MMALPRPANAWTGGLDLPSQLFEGGSNDYELYEQDDQFVLTVELPGFDPEEITVSWNDGVLNVAGEHEDEARGTRRTYHRRFRFPKTVDDDGIEASYENGILTVWLPVAIDAAMTGTEIEIES
ncbi:MAG: molecular chaperone, small heat shock protein [uncultured archaeon A07HR67]|jgi:HSP20 family protein|nr:MAG: molecular chaperone, small heat shock protein [uncultured archaeon A07HR67]